MSRMPGQSAEVGAMMRALPARSVPDWPAGRGPGGAGSIAGAPLFRAQLNGEPPTNWSAGSVVVLPSLPDTQLVVSTPAVATTFWKSLWVQVMVAVDGPRVASEWISSASSELSTVRSRWAPDCGFATRSARPPSATPGLPRSMVVLRTSMVTLPKPECPAPLNPPVISDESSVKLPPALIATLFCDGVLSIHDRVTVS